MAAKVYWYLTSDLPYYCLHLTPFLCVWIKFTIRLTCGYTCICSKPWLILIINYLGMSIFQIHNETQDDFEKEYIAEPLGSHEEPGNINYPLCTE